MKQTNSNQKGFTIVELLIVIIIISILAGLIVTTFSDFRRKSRNSERQNDIKFTQQAVENYYAQNEKYPTLGQLNDSAWRAKNMKTLGADELQDPSGTKASLATAPAANIYSYQPVAQDDGVCDNVTRDCMKYTLTATQEGGEVFTKNNFN
jgi:prepilin-type N-terminal cleavage/methylation domain-containing protein